ncbi:MAG: hypothetical protein ACTHJL_10900 [Amnibacterium sp.]
MTATSERARTRPAGPERRRAVRTEVAGLGAALAVALVAVAHLCLTPRAWILFSDADSVLLPLLRASSAVGERQDWALSSVLFLPERALYDATAALGLGVRANLAIDAVLNLVLLYACLRLVAALLRRGTRAACVTGALLAFSAFAAFTLLDSSAAWDGFELPSLTATTTYYSATLLATAVAVGLGAAVLARRRARAAAAVLAVLTAASVLTNPLFLAWAAAPLVLTALLLLLLRRVAGRSVLLLGGALATGSLVGFLARIPFAAGIVRSTADYADPSNALPTLAYLAHDLAARIGTVEGLVSVAAIDTAIVVDALLAVRAIRDRRTEAAVLLSVAVLGPLAVTAGTVLLGAPAVRYLQPVWLLPLLPLVLVRLPARLPGRLHRTRTALAVALAVAGVAGLGVTAASAATPDASIGCLARWIVASGRTGAGRFETIRGPKAYLPDPRRLLQVDGRLHAVEWLADRADYADPWVSFLVTDATTPPFATATAGPPVRTISCGRYRVLDWGAPVLRVTTGGPILPPHPPGPITDGTAAAP